MKITKILILSFTVIAIIYDIVALCLGWGTISRVVITWSQSFIFIPFAYGVLATHFFYPHKQGIKTWQLITFIAISVLILIYCISAIFMNDAFTEFIKRYPVIMLFVGMPVGYLWVQKDTRG